MIKDKVILSNMGSICKKISWQTWIFPYSLSILYVSLVYSPGSWVWWYNLTAICAFNGGLVQKANYNSALIESEYPENNKIEETSIHELFVF